MKASEHRIELYKYIADLLGREITDKEHDILKQKMQSYVAEHGEQASLNKSGGIKHTYLCRECQKEKSARGKLERAGIKGTNFSKGN